MYLNLLSPSYNGKQFVFLHELVGLELESTFVQSVFECSCAKKWPDIL